ncbi:transposon Tf2-9 polyprotein [Elysia marginata]|uniref:Transposon Tf2-9 polyprotein n=1 Tax=Elysia marginata TaxID=1093978 RepID=A0AAV4HDI6_9GAST|nr:transposon Tf2-9 polyprotein [Elysia marginata]
MEISAPLAPWWGGWWERLIRSIKSALRKSLGQTLVTRIQLETVLLEIEACVDSRPLTYVGETEQPLTPSHFLIGRSSALNPVMVDEYSGEAAVAAARLIYDLQVQHLTGEHRL